MELTVIVAQPQASSTAWNTKLCYFHYIHPNLSFWSSLQPSPWPPLQGPPFGLLPWPSFCLYSLSINVPNLNLPGILLSFLCRLCLLCPPLSLHFSPFSVVCPHQTLLVACSVVQLQRNPKALTMISSLLYVLVRLLSSDHLLWIFSIPEANHII